MTSDQTIYLKQELQRVSTGPARGKTTSRINVSAHYGPMEVGAENQMAAIEKMVRQLRTMCANEGLQGEEIAVPDTSSYYAKCIIPAAMLELDAAAFIDREQLKIIKLDE